MTLAYVATVYTKSPGGIEFAYREACRITAALIKTGVHCFSPIAHGHGIAIHGNIDPLDQEFWYAFDKTMLQVCDTLIVAHMDGWESSTGIAHEIEFFEKAGKPIYDLRVHDLFMSRRA